MLELVLWGMGAALAAPDTVVTFDNGEFNAPLYSPRWNGRWRKPSLAQELATSVARVLIETEVAVIDLALSAVDEEAARLLRQIETMHLAYFDRLYADYG